MPCTSTILQSRYGSCCPIHKSYIQAGRGGVDYHGELCCGCMWWEDTDDDIAFWARLQSIGIKRKP